MDQEEEPVERCFHICRECESEPEGLDCCDDCTECDQRIKNGSMGHHSSNCHGIPSGEA